MTLRNPARDAARSAAARYSFRSSEVDEMKTQGVDFGMLVAQRRKRRGPDYLTIHRFRCLRWRGMCCASPALLSPALLSSAYLSLSFWRPSSQVFRGGRNEDASISACWWRKGASVAALTTSLYIAFAACAGDV